MEAAEALGIFKQQVRIAELSEQELMNQVKFIRPALIGKTNMLSDSELGEKPYQITCEEATSKHWLEGPSTFEQISAAVGDTWLPVRRFAVLQKDKVCPIDDFCENHLNRAFSSVDKISLKNNGLYFVVSSYNLPLLHTPWRYELCLVGRQDIEWQGGK